MGILILQVFTILLQLVLFFKSDRVKQYLTRLKVCTCLIIILCFGQCFIWMYFNFADQDYSNTVLVYVTNTILIILNVINFFKLMFFRNMFQGKIIEKLNVFFYFSLVGFLVNMTQTLLTLFNAYLNYFECKKV
jgi:hypothetical protein